jgi:hypothetical protein
MGRPFNSDLAKNSAVALFRGRHLNVGCVSFLSTPGEVCALGAPPRGVFLRRVLTAYFFARYR